MEAPLFACLRRRHIRNLFGSSGERLRNKKESQRNLPLYSIRWQHQAGTRFRSAQKHAAEFAHCLPERSSKRENQIQMDSIQQRCRSKVNI